MIGLWRNVQEKLRASCPAYTGCESGCCQTTMLAFLPQGQVATDAASQENGLHHALQTYNPLQVAAAPSGVVQQGLSAAGGSVLYLHFALRQTNAIR